MDLGQTRSLELEQDAHDYEAREDRNRRKTSGRSALTDTRVGQVQENEGNMREREILSAALKLCWICTAQKQRARKTRKGRVDREERV